MSGTAGETATPEIRAAHGSHLGGTESLRGVLCLLIVWYHVYLYTGPEGPPTRGDFYTLFVSRWQLGLTFFFVLSAFLLYRPFVQSILNGRPRPAFGAYLANRVLRIMPAYWVILLAAAIAGVLVVWIPTHDYGFHLPTFVANLLLVHGFHPSGMQTGVPPSWSLIVEWGYYLLLPLLVLLALKVGGRSTSRRRRVLAVLVPPLLLLVVGAIGRELARRSVTPEDPFGVLNTWYAVLDKSFLAWADTFAVGMAIAVVRVQLEDGRLRLPRGWRAGALLGWIGLSAVLIAAHASGRLEWHHYNLLMGIPIGLFVCAVVLFSGDSRRDPLMRTLENPALVRLGDISLSVYLIHYPVIVFLVGKGVYRDGWLGMAFNAALVAAIVLPLAYLNHRFVERPFMRRKVRTKAPGPPPPQEPATAAPVRVAV